MNKTVLINLTLFTEQKAIDVEFDLSSYFFDRNIGHGLARIDNFLYFEIFNINKKDYDLFIKLLQDENLIFIEKE